MSRRHPLLSFGRDRAAPLVEVVAPPNGLGCSALSSSRGRSWCSLRRAEECVDILQRAKGERSHESRMTLPTN